MIIINIYIKLYLRTSLHQRKYIYLYHLRDYFSILLHKLLLIDNNIFQYLIFNLLSLIQYIKIHQHNSSFPYLLLNFHLNHKSNLSPTLQYAFYEVTKEIKLLSSSKEVFLRKIYTHFYKIHIKKQNINKFIKTYITFRRNG